MADLEKLVDPATRGDPESWLRWTSKSVRKLAEELAGMGHRVSYPVVAELLREMGYSLQSNRKTKEGDSHPDRNAQFEYINARVQQYIGLQQPVISVDTKKKELVGDFKNAGQNWMPQGKPDKVRVHDFLIPELGRAAPYGIYDLANRHAHINLNTSHDTGELCCDSIALWWEKHGRRAYPRAARLLILCDGGGSNSATQYLFKQDLQRLATRLGLEIRVAHYPPYCSKHNPIEHRVFPHITRACQGVIFHTMEIAGQFIEQAKTSTGLRVTVDVLDKVYVTGRKCVADFKQTMKILFDAHLPNWNYRAVPESG